MTDLLSIAFNLNLTSAIRSLLSASITSRLCKICKRLHWQDLKLQAHYLKKSVVLTANISEQGLSNMVNFTARTIQNALTKLVPVDPHHAKEGSNH